MEKEKLFDPPKHVNLVTPSTKHLGTNIIYAYTAFDTDNDRLEEKFNYILSHRIPIHKNSYEAYIDGRLDKYRPKIFLAWDRGASALVWQSNGSLERVEYTSILSVDKFIRFAQQDLAQQKYNDYNACREALT